MVVVVVVRKWMGISRSVGDRPAAPLDGSVHGQPTDNAGILPLASPTSDIPTSLTRYRVTGELVPGKYKYLAFLFGEMQRVT